MTSILLGDGEYKITSKYNVSQRFLRGTDGQHEVNVHILLHFGSF